MWQGDPEFDRDLLREYYGGVVSTLSFLGNHLGHDTSLILN